MGGFFPKYLSGPVPGVFGPRSYAVSWRRFAIKLIDSTIRRYV